MKNFIETLARHQIILSALIVVIFASAVGIPFLTSYVKQEAAVIRPGNCYLSKDIDARIAEKKRIEDLIANSDVTVKSATDAISNNVKALTAAKAEIKDLTRKIKSDYAISLEKKKVDTLAAKLDTAKRVGTRNTNVTSIEVSLKAALTIYNKLLADNQAQKDKLASLEADVVRFTSLAPEYDQKLLAVKKQVEDAKAMLPQMDAYVKGAQNNQCPKTESLLNQCGDGIDNDKDGGGDCGDPDCIAAPNCIDPKSAAVAPSVEEPASTLRGDGTELSYEAICDDGVDNNNNHKTDCADSTCSDSEYCRSLDAKMLHNSDPNTKNPACKDYQLFKDKLASLEADLAQYEYDLEPLKLFEDSVNKQKKALQDKKAAYDAKYFEPNVAVQVTMDISGELSSLDAQIAPYKGNIETLEDNIGLAKDEIAKLKAAIKKLDAACMTI